MMRYIDLIYEGGFQEDYLNSHEKNLRALIIEKGGTVLFCEVDGKSSGWFKVMAFASKDGSDFDNKAIEIVGHFNWLVKIKNDKPIKVFKGSWL
jgi:hypothetical protein